MKSSNHLENKTFRHLVQAASSLEPPLEHNQGQMPLTNQGSL